MGDFSWLYDDLATLTGDKSYLKKKPVTPPTPSSPTALTQPEIENVLRSAGWDERHVPKMAAIAMGESAKDKQGRALVNSFNPGVGPGGVPTKEKSAGLFQVNLLAHPQYDKQKLISDPTYAAKAALDIFNERKSKGQDPFGPWGAYTNGSYRQFYKGRALSQPQQGASGNDYSFVQNDLKNILGDAISPHPDYSFVQDDLKKLGLGDIPTGTRPAPTNPIQTIPQSSTANIASETSDALLQRLDQPLEAPNVGLTGPGVTTPLPIQKKGQKRVVPQATAQLPQSRTTEPTASQETIQQSAPPPAPVTDADYQQYVDSVSKWMKPMTREEFNQAAISAPQGSVTASARTGNPIVDNQEVQGEQEQPTPDGGAVRYPRVVGTPNSKDAVAGVYRYPAGMSKEDAAKNAFLNVARQYGGTEDNYKQFLAKNQREQMTSWHPDQPGEVNVTFSALKDAGLDVDTQRRMEESQARVEQPQPNLKQPAIDAPLSTQNIANAVKEYTRVPLFGYSEAPSGLVGGAVQNVGDLAGVMAGIMKASPVYGSVNEIISNGGTTPNRARDVTADNLLDFYRDANAFSEATGAKDENGKDTIPTMLFKGIGQAPEYAAMSMLPGGLITGISLKNAALARAEDKPWNEVVKQGAWGIPEGALFEFLPKSVQKAIGIEGGAVKQAFRVGTEVAGIGGGIYGLETLRDPNISVSDKLKNAISIGLFHLWGSTKGAIKGQIAHVVDPANGIDTYVKVEGRDKAVVVDKQKPDFEMVMPKVEDTPIAKPTEPLPQAAPIAKPIESLPKAEKPTPEVTTNSKGNLTVTIPNGDNQPLGELKTQRNETDKALNTVSVTNVRVAEDARRQGLATQMYGALLDQLPTDVKGIRLSDVTTSEAIPEIYKKLGAVKEDGETIIPNPRHKPVETPEQPKVEAKAETPKVEEQPNIVKPKTAGEAKSQESEPTLTATQAEATHTKALEQWGKFGDVVDELAKKKREADDAVIAMRVDVNAMKSEGKNRISPQALLDKYDAENIKQLNSLYADKQRSAADAEKNLQAAHKKLAQLAQVKDETHLAWQNATNAERSRVSESATKPPWEMTPAELKAKYRSSIETGPDYDRNIATAVGDVIDALEKGDKGAAEYFGKILNQRAEAKATPESRPEQTAETGAKVYFRGETTGREQTIKTGNPEWDDNLFLSKEEKHARLYSDTISQYRPKPDAKILQEGTRAFDKLVPAKPFGTEKAIDRDVRALKAAKEAGYDIVEFRNQSDVGTVVMNRDAVEKINNSTSEQPKTQAPKTAAEAKVAETEPSTVKPTEPTVSLKAGDQVEMRNKYGIKKVGTVFADKEGHLHVEEAGTKARLSVDLPWEKTTQQLRQEKAQAKVAKKSFTNPDNLKIGDYASSENRVGRVYDRKGQLRVKYEADGKVKSEPLNDAWRKSANPEAGTVSPELLTLGLNKTISEDITPTIKRVGRGMLSAVDDVKKLVFAADRGDAAKLAGGTLRTELAKTARNYNIAQTALKDARKAFAKSPIDDNYDFIAHVESGDTSSLPPAEQPMAKALRQLLDDARTRVQNLGTGKLENYIENYFPHIWEDPKKAASVFAKTFAKRPFEGSKAFLKQRYYNTFQEGLDAGLKPVSDNPVDLALLKIRDMDRYVAAHNTINYLKSQGLAQFVRLGEQPPDGMIKIDDRISEIRYRNDKGELVTAGHLYAAEPAATIINNYLSPGLSGSKSTTIREGYKAWRYMGNMMNQAQLGLSAFHAMFTTIDAVTSKAALGINQLFTLHPIKAAKTFAETPISPVTNFIRGNKLLREGLMPGTTDPVTAAMADLVTEAGGRFKMDDFYHTKAAQKMTDAFRRGNLLGGIVRLPAGVLDLASRPLMEGLVPRQKLGVFADMAKHTVERLGPDATPEQLREALGKDWDSVDNRMGQLVYDNLFWNKTIKDLSMASVRSVGWNLGDIRELGGAVKDTITLPVRVRQALKGEKMPVPVVTQRMAYTAALPIVAGIIGATTQYLFTGKGPTELKDYFFPKTGNTDENGNAERLNLPTYMKDVYAYGFPDLISGHPRQALKKTVKTLGHKAHPLIGLVSEMLANKDYYGTEIRNADDPFIQQLTDEVKHIGKGFIPFSFQGVLKERERQGSTAAKTLSFFGFNPAPKDIDTTTAQDMTYEWWATQKGDAPRPKEVAARNKEIADLVRLKKRGRESEFNTEFDKAVKAGIISQSDMEQVNQRISRNFFQYAFGRMPLDTALDVYEAANKEERQQIAQAMDTKIRNATAKGHVTPTMRNKMRDLGLNK